MNVEDTEEKKKLLIRTWRCLEAELDKIKGRYYESTLTMLEDINDAVSWCTRVERDNLMCMLPYHFEHKVIEGGVRYYWVRDVYAGGLSYMWGTIECYEKPSNDKIVVIGLLGYKVYTAYTSDSEGILLYLPLALSPLLVDHYKINKGKKESNMVSKEAT